ncbi:helix-turn-helix transcriptional regulator [Pedobacter sp. V48]|uniref:helix-turn-helix transcriptional regulator n=1 Tax=Pedobacter sp. V48 TaxID=509635 RepID=UPI0003E482BA|nr:helix-turn-helix transcriptional regulator [Pedobacter sp. V48]ETZ22038.1 hypothetical protein N824_24250 [Pedobacter sp. V48]
MEHNAGEIIELAVRRQNVNISDLSRRMHVNRRTLYNWFKQRKLHTDVIIEIGKAINHDFSADFQNDFRGLGSVSAYKDESSSSHSDSVYYWMEKYISLLEDYKKLVQKGSHQKTLS